MKLSIWLCLILLGCGRGAGFVTTGGVCEGYDQRATSPYLAPWPSDIERDVAQGNCSNFSHSGPFRFAYDILMPIGSSILAARSGVVIEVVDDQKDGNGCSKPENHIFVRHDDGSVGTYLHLTQAGSLVQVGTPVTQGQDLGRSGNSGCSTQPHLHFEVKTTTGSQNSLPVVFSNIDSRSGRLEARHSYRPF